MYFTEIDDIQSNLSTTATLGTPKKWPLYNVGRSLQVFQSKLVLKVAWPDLGWPLLTGGRYSEVAVNTGLTVCPIGIEEYSFTALKGSAPYMRHPVQQKKFKFLSH